MREIASLSHATFAARYFSRKDIGVIAGCGCPSIDRKVVNSGKRLRAHVGINEGHVCTKLFLPKRIYSKRNLFFLFFQCFLTNFLDQSVRDASVYW